MVLDQDADYGVGKVSPGHEEEGDDNVVESLVVVKVWVL